MTKENWKRHCVLVGIVIAVFMTSCERRGHGPFGSCQHNLVIIGRALSDYRKEHGRFPPTVTFDDKGKPMHSWRILLLPYMENESLKKRFSQYDFSEPWDGPNNRKLHDIVADVYTCPLTKNKNETSYLAVTGGEPGWDQWNSSHPGEVFFSITVAEVANSGIHWLEPRDMQFSDLSRGINPVTGVGLSSNHKGGAFVIWGEQHTKFVPDGTDPSELAPIRVDDSQ